jgi:hypothetical protein
LDRDEWPVPNKGIRYDKGESRHKHSGHHPEARIVWKTGTLIGECPKGFPLDVAESLLQEAIPEYRKTIPDKPVWTYHEGAVYAARSQDGGRTWHGYPAQDPPRDVLRKLEQRARERGERQQLKTWLAKRWDKTL